MFINIILIITQPHAFISICRNAPIIIAIRSVGQASATRV